MTATAFTAAVKLRLRRPEFEALKDDVQQASWNALHEAYNDLNKAVQRGMGDALIHIRNIRADGKRRFQTRAERSAGVESADCYTRDDLTCFQKLLSDAIKASGLSEYVYSSVSQRLAQAEFTGDKLRRLLSGEIAFPVPTNVGLMVRNRNWDLELVQETDVDGRESTRPIITITSLRPKGERVRLVCDTLHWRAAKSFGATLARLAALAKGEAADGYEQGTLKLRRVQRPGCPAKYEIELAYKSPKVERAAGTSIMAVHRGMVNVLTAAYVTDDAADFAGHSCKGDDIIAAKQQMLARRAAIMQTVAGYRRNAAGSGAFAKLKRLGDKEARVVDTACWKLARWVQTMAEQYNARLVLVEDFSNWLGDVQDENGRYVLPYLRRWPFFKLKTRIKDALQRRAGIEVVEVLGKYISQRCPVCEHTTEENVARLPRLNKGTTQDGQFKCTECAFTMGLDQVASMNMLMRSKHVTDEHRARIRERMTKHAKVVETMRQSLREKSDADPETDSDTDSGT